MYQLLVSFAITFILIKIAIKLSSKIYHPTRDDIPKTENIKTAISPFGGICMFVSSLILCFIYLDYKNFVFLVPSILMFLLGLYDDLEKLTSKKHNGITAKKKFFCQGVAGVIVCLIAFYYNPNFDEYKLIIPFWGVVDFKMPLVLSFVIPFCAFISTTNATNLTDGLDGLAGKQVLVVLIFIIFILHLVKFDVNINLKEVIFIFIGTIIAFLTFNTSPASIFMGDSGSMFLGSLIASVFIVLKLELLLPFICFVFGVETLSVIIQVGYFKITKGRRFFKMSPIHHHFQLLGFKEEKITEVAFFITLLIALLFLTPFYA